jgi:hypothetical protein
MKCFADDDRTKHVVKSLCDHDAMLGLAAERGAEGSQGASRAQHEGRSLSRAVIGSSHVSQRDDRQLLVTSVEADVECEPRSPLSADAGLRRRAGRASWPLRPRFEPRSSLGRSSRVIDFVWSPAVERCVRPVTVEPGREGVEQPQTGMITLDRGARLPNSVDEFALRILSRAMWPTALELAGGATERLPRTAEQILNNP